MTGRYTTEDLRRLAPGVTMRKINWWCNEGGVFGDEHMTPGSGNYRLFDDEDLHVAQVLGHVSFSIAETFSAPTPLALARDLSRAVRQHRARAHIAISTNVAITVDIVAILAALAERQKVAS